MGIHSKNQGVKLQVSLLDGRRLRLEIYADQGKRTVMLVLEFKV